jgi:hypothetical protein
MGLWCAAAFFVLVFLHLPVIAQTNDGRGMALSSLRQMTAITSVSVIAYIMVELRAMLPLPEDIPRWSSLQGSLRAIISLVVDISRTCIFRKTTVDVFLARRNPWPPMAMLSELCIPWT